MSSPAVRSLVRGTRLAGARCRRLATTCQGLFQWTQVPPAALEDFRAYLTRSESDGGRGLKMKTARDIIDGCFRTLYRDARQTDRLVHDDPFAALKWPAKADPEPAPFTEEERDQLMSHFAQRNPH